MLLSVGYSSCHWCHVMAHESFEDAAIAALMNEAFVSIKVDREERPDIDSVYMTATQALTGQGGWPMTVFLSADGRPFFAGTYFPPQDGYGRPGFRRVLETIRDRWASDREGLLRSADDLTTRMQQLGAGAGAAGGDVDASAPAQAVERLRASFDAEWGGFGAAPKFPTPPTLEVPADAPRPRRRRGRGRAERARHGAAHACGGCRAAACTTTSAAVSRATASMSGGWCPTSRRCCTTTRSWCAPTCMPTRSAATAPSSASHARRSAT